MVTKALNVPLRCVPADLVALVARDSLAYQAVPALHALQARRLFRPLRGIQVVLFRLAGRDDLAYRDSRERQESRLFLESQAHRQGLPHRVVQVVRVCPFHLVAPRSRDFHPDHVAPQALDRLEVQAVREGTQYILRGCQK